MESWEVVQEFPMYVINPEGVVKNRYHDTYVKPRQNKQNFVMINLTDMNNVRRTRSVALMVAKAYLPKPLNATYNSIIHLDNDRGNCSATNLMWRPRWYALLYRRMFNEEPVNTSVIVEETGEIFGTLREACEKYGLYDKYTYINMVNREPCFHYHYRFKPFDPNGV